MHSEEDIVKVIEDHDLLTFDQSFQFAQICSNFLKQNESLQDGRKLVINILNNWHKIPASTHEIWTDLIESAGFYPYLHKNQEYMKLNNFSAQLRKELHGSFNLPSKYFHDEQHEILKLLKSDKNVIVSAPTSFGKSLLIEEIVASNSYKNIVIIQPTLALLDETRRKLTKYKNQYQLIVRTSQEPHKIKGNIFLFTAERVNEYNQFTNVDFLVVDEFYKLSGKRDDERSSSLNNALHYLLKNFSPKFYLLGPNIDGISSGFAERYNAIFYKSSYSLVDSREIPLYKEYEGEFGQRGKKKEYKEEVLFELLYKLKDEQSLIYCSSPARVRYLSKKYTQFLMEKDFDFPIEHYSIIEWIEKYITDDWSVLKCLRYNIGIHDGALQKHISTTIIDYFNQKKLRYLFCTSTIIEGVNTSTKNIIYFDSTKGGNPIDYFDYSNIKGRAGRMMEHYVGYIYNFNPPPKNESIIIDIPFFEQNPIKDEVLIQLHEEEVKYPESEQYNSLNKIPFEEREIIKRNGIKVYGQKSIFDILRKDIYENYDLINWISPSYKQLGYILGLAWDNLIIEGETVAPMTKSKLVKTTFDYAINRDIGYLVRSHYTYQRSLEKNKDVLDSDLRDIAIQETFQIMKHWFEYKVPKWLSVINDIQRFICNENGLRAGNYIRFANLIENDFLRDNLSILAEYGIPSSAIRKIESKIPSTINQDDVLDFIKRENILSSPELLEYEKIKLEENLT